MPDAHSDQQKKDQQKYDRLNEIRRARNRLFVCFWTFPVYVLVVTRLLDAGSGIQTIMFSYMLLYAGFGINASLKRCPECHQQFFVRKYFLNPFSSQCAHCGQSFKHAD